MKRSGRRTFESGRSEPISLGLRSRKFLECCSQNLRTQLVQHCVACCWFLTQERLRSRRAATHASQMDFMPNSPAPATIESAMPIGFFAGNRPAGIGRAWLCVRVIVAMCCVALIVCSRPGRADDMPQPLQIPSPIQEETDPIGGDFLYESPACNLPPTRPQGPVMFDVPCEELPSCPDDCIVPGAGFPACFDDLWSPRPWFWQLMPNNLIYTSYLAGPKESRIGSVVYNDTAPAVDNPSIQEGTLWDTTLGGRASILRYGSDSVVHPQGLEVQIEGAAFVRLDPESERDVRSSDYRFGVPIVYGVGRWQTKLAYYHNSAHLGDEFMIKHPTFPRINYVRDCIVWGNSYYAYDWLRLYGEVGYSFYNAGGSQPWEFQFGTELIQARPTGGRGAPFLAVNGMSRQELDWGGNVCVQAGWAWRGRRSEKLYRIGFEYLYGSDPQYEFVYNNQNRCGVGMWYDY
jgi:Protein of unknown function (DUF1207)